MDVSDRTARRSALRIALSRITFAVFLCVVAVIVVLVGVVLLGATGLSSDPHGYGVIAGILLTAMLSPVALVLWLLYRWLRRGGG
ncbi:hypothetical protein ACFXGA_32110 [Actinosynnema sp. NPDC059335]|uniref:hypothetical protein n=1 Tax=Actinosynnema sp. NPDC059335 TaxID=3346804 RepID=UPI00366A6A18